MAPVQPPPLHGSAALASMAGQDGIHAGAIAENRLLEAAERALRASRNPLALALHLSRLHVPPRPYHTRIATALMQDAARRFGGQVFALRNADLVLLAGCPADAGPGSGAPPPCLALRASLERLFGAGAAGAPLISLWQLGEAAGAFRDYVSQRRADPVGSDGGEDVAAPSAGLAGMPARLRQAGLRALLVQQTAVALRPGRGLPVSVRLTPFFREIQFHPAALAAGDAALLADPFLLRHATAQLDGGVLALLRSDLEAAGPLTRPALRLGVPMHLNLSPAAIISPGFARLAQAAAAHGARFAVELHAMDAAAEPALTAFACKLLTQAGFGLVLDGIDHAGLTMIRPGQLKPGLVKLAWSPRLAETALPGIASAIDAIGPDRIVLQEADGEAALLWGQTHGITRFQGPYLDAVQAASRIAVCHGARSCTLRQCTRRALALDPRERAGCGNPGLLDMPPHFVSAGQEPAMCA